MIADNFLQESVIHNHYYNFKYNNLILNYYIEYLKLYKDSILMVPKSDVDSEIILFDKKSIKKLNLKYNNIYIYHKKDKYCPEYANSFIYFNLYGSDHIIKNILIKKEYSTVITKKFEIGIYINKTKIENKDFTKDIMELFKSVYEDLNNEIYDNRVYNFIFLDKI